MATWWQSWLAEARRQQNWGAVLGGWHGVTVAARGGDGASREGANAMAAWQWWCFDDGGGLEVGGLAVESSYKCLVVKGV
jgi:hypothetical protein